MKLYPPMGFAALGNADLKGADSANFWGKEGLPDWTNRPDFGILLDRAMNKLFDWCEVNDVPVMAHTAMSNGVATQYQELAGSKYWEASLSRHRKLRVSFGHFGDTEEVKDGISLARRFAALMNAGEGQSCARSSPASPCRRTKHVSPPRPSGSACERARCR